MIKQSLSSLRQRLHAIHSQMAALLPVLLGREPLLPAYLTFQPRTCGNPGCKCARGERHPAWIVQFSAGGRQKSRSLPKARFAALKGPADAYRRFRAARAAWNRLVGEANTVLKEIEQCRSVKVEEAFEKPGTPRTRRKSRRSPKEPATSRSSRVRSSGSSMRSGGRTRG